MRPHVQALLGVCLLGGALATAAEAPLYTNVRIVSVDARTRALVVRDNEGRSRLLHFDPQVAVPPLRRGEEVIVAIEGGADGQRVSTILRSQAPAGEAALQQGTTAAAEDPGRAGTGATSFPAPPEPVPSAALDTYANRVAALAQQALRVDADWNTFVQACGVSVTVPRSRGWFALWEPGSLRVDLTSGVCRELHNEVVAGGEQVKGAMLAAAEEARRAGLLPGALREIRARYDMDWVGWALPPPAPLIP
jgi:hypothetical protein